MSHQHNRRPTAHPHLHSRRAPLAERGECRDAGPAFESSRGASSTSRPCSPEGSRNLSASHAPLFPCPRSPARVCGPCSGTLNAPRSVSTSRHHESSTRLQFPGLQLLHEFLLPVSGRQAACRTARTGASRPRRPLPPAARGQFVRRRHSLEHHPAQPARGRARVHVCDSYSVSTVFSFSLACTE